MEREKVRLRMYWWDRVRQWGRIQDQRISRYTNLQRQSDSGWCVCGHIGQTIEPCRGFLLVWAVAAILYSYRAFYSPYKHPPNTIFGISHQTGVSRGEKSKRNKGKQNQTQYAVGVPPTSWPDSLFVNEILWWQFEIIAIQQLLLHFKLVNVMSASFPKFPHGHLN